MTCEHCCCERPRTPAALSQVIALSRADGEGEKVQRARKYATVAKTIPYLVISCELQL